MSKSELDSFGSGNPAWKNVFQYIWTAILSGFSLDTVYNQEICANLKRSFPFADYMKK